MEKVTITKTYRTNKDKQGNKLMTKDGREYTRLAIQTKEYPGKWISGFENITTGQWTEGDKVEVIVEQNGQYLNFRLAPKTVSRQDFDALVKRVEALELAQLKGNLEEPPLPEEDNIPEDL